MMFELHFVKYGCLSLNSVRLIMVTITSHIFSNIFPKEHLLILKRLVCNEKNMGFNLIPKTYQVEEKFVHFSYNVVIADYLMEL